jgi:hypothetical protein
MKYKINYRDGSRVFDFGKLTRKELFLLHCFPEEVAAAFMFTSVETIRFWTKKGMPVIEVLGAKVYSWPMIHKWLNAPFTKGAKTTNLQRLFMITPANLVPRYMSIKDKKKKFAAFWLVPVNKKHLPYAEELEKAV